MEPKVVEIAERIRSLRESEGFSQKEMAKAVGTSLGEYVEMESGKKDFSLSLLYKCAEKLGVDMMELLTGETPRITGYVLDRKGDELPVEKHEGFLYAHLASNFKRKTVEPLLVTAPYFEGADKEMKMSTHDGQEFDYILEGRLKLKIGKHVEILEPGDSIFYDSGKEHSMAAIDKGGCRFIAIVIKKEPVG